MGEAYKCAQRSPDPRTQVGAVLATEEVHYGERHLNVLGPGAYNNTPDRIPMSISNIVATYGAEKKYASVVHAEAKVLYNAVRNGVPMQNLTLIAPWAACAECAKTMIELGVRRLIRHGQLMRHVLKADASQTWTPSIRWADFLFSMAGVEILELDTTFGSDYAIRVYNEVWVP
jgi:deoxycytidylate deaminase